MQWPRFGPYHIARLQELGKFARSYGAELVALETAGRDRVYQWREIENGLDFQRVQIFPGHTFEEIRPDQMHRGVAETLDRLNPDGIVINSYSFPDARACLSWCRINRKVAVVATDTKEDAAPRVAWRERFKSVLVDQFDAALLAGSPHREYFEKLGVPTDYIFLGCDVVDNDFFAENSARVRVNPAAWRHLPGLHSDHPFFLTCGRFIPQKNLELLIRAYAQYRASAGEPWRLVMVGDGPLRSSYEELITDLRVEGITLTGFRQYEELPAYYGLAAAYVHPAVNDQWGLVVNEAMASGLPVAVSTRSGCFQDLVMRDENGYRFDPGDSSELTRLLLRLSSPSTNLQALGSRSREIISQWSLSLYASQAWSALQKGLSRANRRMDLRVQIALWSMRKLSRSVTSFHTVKP